MFVCSGLWFECQPLPGAQRVALGWLTALGTLTAITVVSALHEWAPFYV